MGPPLLSALRGPDIEARAFGEPLVFSDDGDAQAERREQCWQAYVAESLFAAFDLGRVTASLFIKLRPSMRQSIESAIESLIGVLDEIDGNPDVEDDDSGRGARWL